MNSTTARLYRPKMIALLVAVVCAFSCMLPQASVAFPVAQEEMTGVADFGTGNGQSFLLPGGETIRSIDLFIDRGSNGSVNVHLWKTIRTGDILARAKATPEATGTLMQRDVQNMPPGWFRITLDQPYTNPSTTEDEELVFDLELLTSVGDGWNDYGYSNRGSYAAGTFVTWGGTIGYQANYSVDFTFRIVSEDADDFIYIDYQDGVQVVNYKGTDPNCVVPETIDGKPVRRLHAQLFYNPAVNVQTVSLPANLVSIDDGTFGYMGWQFSRIDVDPGNPYFTSVDGVLFDKAQTTLRRHPQGLSGTFIIPSSVTTIAASAFRYCASLTAVNIPEGVTSIGDFAFESCSSIASLDLPSTLTSIGVSSFRFMINLTAITIPESLTRVTTRAFEGCTSLASATIEGGVEVISSYVFKGCSSLQSLVIPASVTTIGAFTFHECTSLEDLTFVGAAPDLVNSVFASNPVTMGIYHPAAETGYAGEDWDALTLYPYTGPHPDNPYRQWLARGAAHTATPVDDLIPNSSVPYLVGYAFNIDLSQNPGGQLLGPPVVTGSEMTLTFAGGSSDVIYTPRASADLSDWDALSVVLSEPGPEGNRTATVDITGLDRCYIRIDVQLMP